MGGVAPPGVPPPRAAATAAEGDGGRDTEQVSALQQVYATYLAAAQRGGEARRGSERRVPEGRSTSSLVGGHLTAGLSFRGPIAAESAARTAAVTAAAAAVPPPPMPVPPASAAAGPASGALPPPPPGALPGWRTAAAAERRRVTSTGPTARSSVMLTHGDDEEEATFQPYITPLPAQYSSSAARVLANVPFQGA